jgi:hypothetical protein
MMQSQHRSLPQVGAPDPELRNSPIAAEEDEETEVVRQQAPGAAQCYFNNTPYPHGAYVASGSQVLRCSYGVWIDSGSADSRNP